MKARNHNSSPHYRSTVDGSASESRTPGLRDAFERDQTGSAPRQPLIAGKAKVARPFGPAMIALECLGLLAGGAMCATAAPTLVTLGYDEPRPLISPHVTKPHTGIAIPYYDEDGFLTKPLGPLRTKSPFGMAIYGVGSLPNNGTPYIKLAYGSSYEVFGMEGEVFNAISIDLGEYSYVFPVPRTIGFMGTKSDGSTVRTSFTLDGIVAFETFQFPESFRGLVNLQATTDLFSLDNLKLFVMPPPPVITDASASATTLWPPNGKMKAVELAAQVEGGCDETRWEIAGVECNETCPVSDMRIVDDHTVHLRATRSGSGGGRIYTVWLQATDAAGNLSELFAVEVTVPHDKSGRN